jgi:hypothetical protein
MVVLCNRRLGPAVELLVAPGAAGELLREVADAARAEAAARWEHELVTWLERCAVAETFVLDVTDIAWTPDHFEPQRAFLLAAIRRASVSSAHTRVLGRWSAMIEAHPRESVQVGRLWRWPAVAGSPA